MVSLPLLDGMPLLRTSTDLRIVAQETLFNSDGEKELVVDDGAEDEKPNAGDKKP